jgi:hypothetical protein
MADDYRISFAQLVGKKIAISSQLLGPKDELHYVMPRGIEAGGIWVESKELTQKTMENLKIQAVERTPVIFLPYHQIYVVIAHADSVALSESAFGIED